MTDLLMADVPVRTIDRESFLGFGNLNPEDALNLVSISSERTQGNRDRRLIDWITNLDNGFQFNILPAQDAIEREFATGNYRADLVEAIRNSNIFRDITFRTSEHRSGYQSNRLDAEDFIRLFNWGGDAFFSILDISFQNGEVFGKLNFARLQQLLMSDWRQDTDCVDGLEVLLTLMLYWEKRSHSDIAYEVTVMYWAEVLADVVLRGVVARRNKMDAADILLYQERTSLYAILMSIPGYHPQQNGSPLGWFILAQIPLHAEKTLLDANYDPVTDEYTVAIFDLIKRGMNVHVVAPYIAAGVHPSLVVQVIEHDLDVDLAVTLSKTMMAAA